MGRKRGKLLALQHSRSSPGQGRDKPRVPRSRAGSGPFGAHSPTGEATLQSQAALSLAPPRAGFKTQVVSDLRALQGACFDRPSVLGKHERGAGRALCLQLLRGGVISCGPLIPGEPPTGRDTAGRARTEPRRFSAGNADTKRSR